MKISFFGCAPVSVDYVVSVMKFLGYFEEVSEPYKIFEYQMKLGAVA